MTTMTDDVHLTPREIEILTDLATLGGTYRQIGARLYISPYTVRRHLADVREKLDVHTTIEAFIALGWLRPLASVIPVAGEGA